MTPLVLASASPQRSAILTQLGIAFEVVVSDVEELTSGDAVEVVRENARRKARAVAQKMGTPVRLVLGVDTDVWLDGEILGKPTSEADARAMLGRLNGRTHEVHSGVALVEGLHISVHHARTRVRFRNLGADALDAYVATGEWRGRAGGFAIQLRGAALIDGIDGEYLNVVGLPVGTLLNARPDLMF